MTALASSITRPSPDATILGIDDFTDEAKAVLIEEAHRCIALGRVCATTTFTDSSAKARRVSSAATAVA